MLSHSWYWVPSAGKAPPANPANAEVTEEPQVIATTATNAQSTTGSEVSIPTPKTPAPSKEKTNDTPELTTEELAKQKEQEEITRKQKEQEQEEIARKQKEKEEFERKKKEQEDKEKNNGPTILFLF